MKYGNLDGQGIAEIRNYNFQALEIAPTTNVYEGRFYYNTIDHTLYVYNGTSWIDALNQGKIYLFQNGLEELTGADAGKVQIKLATGANAGNVTFTVNSNGLAGTVADASTSVKGVIEIATDVEAAETQNPSETLAINPKQLQTKIGKTDLSIDSGSTNYLAYDNTNGKFSAKVDTTVTANSTKLVTSGAVASAIALAQAGALKYQTTWTATGQTDYSSITLPVEKGYMYPVSGTATIGGVEWNSGDYLVINKDIASGGTITSADVDKIDNTEASDILRLNATQTMTNKTIDADNNTISNLETDNFKSGVVRTSTDGIRDTSNASDTALVTEKAIASKLAKLVYTETNPALTMSGNQCTWTVTHNLNNTSVGIHVYEVTTGDEVMYDRAITSANVVTVKILATANISAGTYQVVILG